MSVSAAPAGFLAAWLLFAPSAPAVAGGDGSAPVGLTAREAGAVRKAVYGLNASLLRGGRDEAILREVWIGTPSLDEGERARIEAHLRGHLPTMRAVQEVLNLRLYWRSRATEHFVFWWNPAYRGPGGLPARSPTTREVLELEDVARSVAAALSLEVPLWMPYRIDPRAPSARTYPRDDVRWGIWARDAGARAAVAVAVVREAGGVPALWEALGDLFGTCHGDEPCREALLAEAEASVAEAGIVPFLSVLTAGQVGGPEDPARSSALLHVDALAREHGPVRIGQLLGGLRVGLSEEEARRVVRASLGVSARSLDRGLERRILEGRRDRLGR